MAKRKVRHPEMQLCVPDHNVPTKGRAQGIDDPESLIQIDKLRENAAEFGLPHIDVLDDRQGIVHVIGPEQGFTQPGLIMVCGDSHTSTHGAFGALAFGIGTSEVEHVLATQTLIQAPLKNMKIEIEGALPNGITAKDLILKIIGTIGTAGGTGHVIEYCGQAIRDLSMEGRMTVCNMSIEAGARAGLVSPDEKTYEYIKGRPMTPKGGQWEAGARLLEDAAVRRRRQVRHGGEDRRRLDRAAGHLGHQPAGRAADHRARARSDGGGGRVPPPLDRALAAIYGARAGHQAHRHQGAEGVHRLVHQLAHRGSARGREGRARAARWRTASTPWSCRAPG